MDCSVRQLEVAHWVQAKWSRSRWSVHTSNFQKLMAMSSRTLTRRIASFATTPRESTTGWREPVYSDYSICGILVEKAQESLYLHAGIAVRQDAVLRTLDNVEVGDQIRDPVTGKYYAVSAQPEEYTNSGNEGGFAYRDVQLKWLPHYREGNP